ncbi:hypothetical protein [Cupriavidus sp. D384]|uniref:hypothetical protein n=1 Tax=Cupriavidus sp. D384 TaxID=1538095 RepID=UPI0012E70747|nr:hypothetical protein [Cupriavidus sp. D384]
MFLKKSTHHMHRAIYLFFAAVISLHAYAGDPILKLEADYTLEQRGKLLRTEIDKTYQELDRTHSLRRENDISSVVLRYIPIGMSFDDAETVLHYAGFTLGPRPNANPTGNLPGKSAVRAVIGHYTQKFPSKTDVSVLIFPEEPGNYKKGISKINASIIITYP